MTEDYFAQALGLQERFKNKQVKMLRENADDVIESFKVPFENEYGKDFADRVFGNTPEFLRFEIENDVVIIGRNCIENITQTNFTRALGLALDAHEDDIADGGITVLIMHNTPEPELPYIEIII